MPTQRLFFDECQAVRVYVPLYDAFVKGTHAFEVLNKESTAPQHVFVPDGLTKGGEKHILFLFFTTLVTLRSKSSIGFEKMASLYSRQPELFSREVLDRDAESVLQGFRRVGIPHQHSWARYWIQCAQSLFDDFRGDPLFLIAEAQRYASGKNVTEGFLRIKEQLKREKKPYFNGYGEKLFSLFCIFCEELNLVRGITDTMPADVWLQSIALSTGIVSPSAKQSEVNTRVFAEYLRKKLTNFAFRHHMSLVGLSHALWIHGSEVCSRCHKLRDLERACPVYEYCSGRLVTWPYWKRGQWWLQLPRIPRGNHVLFHEGQVDFSTSETLEAKRELRTRHLDQKSSEVEDNNSQMDLLGMEE